MTTSRIDPQQNFATTGIAPMARPGLVTRGFMAVVAFAERMNLRYARAGNPPVYDTRIFPWVAALEAQAPRIRAELLAILRRQSELPSFHDISTDVRTISQDAGWKTFFLCGYGNTSPRNIAQCPATWAAVQVIPGLQTAMFSVLEPGKHLAPHRGPYNGLLRLHLGLVVPEPATALGIRVGRQTHHWEEGRALVFDDAYEHEAWNDSGATRVVLFVDFIKPLRMPASLLNRLLLSLAPFTPFIREGADNHAAWEEKFYGPAAPARPRPGSVIRSTLQKVLAKRATH